MTVYWKNASQLQDDASCRTMCSSFIIYDVTRERVANNERHFVHMFQNTHIGISIVVPTYRTKLQKQNENFAKGKLQPNMGTSFAVF
jgi:hypothetical protein